MSKNYELITIGKYFDVKIFDTYVEKYPKDPMTLEKMKFIVEAQSYLSTKIKGILTCKLVKDQYIWMPKAPGVRVDLYKKQRFGHLKNRQPLIEFESMINREMNTTIKEVEKHGYIVWDFRDVNLFYDKRNNQIYYIDFSNIKLKGKS